MVTGRRNFDIAQAWGGNPPTSPCFVLTHSVPDDWAHEGSPFVFVTDGIGSAIRQAKQAAGEKDVEIGTPSVLQQALNAGLVDEIHIDLVPCSSVRASASSITSRSSPPTSRSSASCRPPPSRTCAIGSHVRLSSGRTRIEPLRRN